MRELLARLLLAALLLSVPWAARGAEPVRSASLLRAADLRADKRPQAESLRSLAPGERVDVLGLEGGWARVRLPAGDGGTGWVRAGLLDLPPQAVAAVPSGRGAATDGSVTLGIRGAPGPRWHALLVIADRPGQPVEPAASDHESALQLAAELDVAEEDRVVLRGASAGAAAIEAAMRQIAGRLGRDDGVLVYFTGVGTLVSQREGPCAQAVLAADGAALTGVDWARWLAPLAAPPRAVLAVIDAGLAWPPQAVSLGLRTPADEGRLLPRFAATDRRCNAPGAVTPLAEAAAGPLTGRDQVLFAAGPAGQALSDEFKGGLLTQYLRDCLMRDARPASGAPDAGAVHACVAERSADRVRGALPASAVVPALHGDPGLPLEPLAARRQLR